VGWDDGWAVSFADAVGALADAGGRGGSDRGGAETIETIETLEPVEPVDGGLLVPGRLVAVDRGEVDVVVHDAVVRAGSVAVDDPDPLLGPCTGDWAVVRRPSPGSAEAPELVALLPRRSAIVRATAGRSSHGQILAANVDTVAVVVSLGDDELDLGRIERFVAVAWESGARPVLVLTKVDAVADEVVRDELVDEAAAVAPGVDVVVTSAPTGEGIDAARAVLTGTIALVGASGAGKSTLANALLGVDRLATGTVRAVDGKGRHTTVRRELIALPGGGALIDTPGLRSVGLWDAADGLALVFADIDALAERCRFRDCAHDREPGCAVRAAVDAGELPARRVESFRKLQRENEWEAARADARLEAERKRGDRSASAALRRVYRDRGRR
jgi:ribosome biogenesis GTPase